MMICRLLKISLIKRNKSQLRLSLLVMMTIEEVEVQSHKDPAISLIYSKFKVGNWKQSRAKLIHKTLLTNLSNTKVYLTLKVVRLLHMAVKT